MNENEREELLAELATLEKRSAEIEKYEAELRQVQHPFYEDHKEFCAKREVDPLSFEQFTDHLLPLLYRLWRLANQLEV